MPSERSLEAAIGERLRSLRLQRGLTQRMLAHRVSGGVDLSYISRIERGEQLPSLKVLQKLGQALDTPLRVFFDAEPPRRAKERQLAIQSLWRSIQKVPPKDLPLLLEVIRVLARHRGESSKYSESVIKNVAAERQRRYRKGRTAHRSSR